MLEGEFVVMAAFFLKPLFYPFSQPRQRVANHLEHDKKAAMTCIIAACSIGRQIVSE
jgi:hypothetical protein